MQKEMQETFYTEAGDHLVGLSLSSVVDRKCRKLGIDYAGVMSSFTDRLCENGYSVLILANAARINSSKPRNNDLMICDRVYGLVSHPDQVRWLHEEMTPEEIRSRIGRCRYLVASRFHAMVGALQKEVPVLLVGWSHKYQEVLDFFELGQYAIDFSSLTLDSLWEAFTGFLEQEEEIRSRLSKNHDRVMESSRDNIRFVKETLDRILENGKQAP